VFGALIVCKGNTIRKKSYFIHEDWARVVKATAMGALVSLLTKIFTINTKL
jgi:hypothetical protein